MIGRFVATICTSQNFLSSRTKMRTTTFLQFLLDDYPTLPDEALVINHIKEEINFDWGRLLEDLHRLSKVFLRTCTGCPKHWQRQIHAICFPWTWVSCLRLNFHEPPPIAHQRGCQFTHVRWANQVLLMPRWPGPIKCCWFLRPRFF